MNNVIKKIIIAVLTVIYGFSLSPALVLAKGSHKHSDDSKEEGVMVSINTLGEIHLQGTVSAISGSTISISTWGGTWSVDASGAKITPSVGGTSNVSLIKVGDKVSIWGKASMANLSVVASKVHDISLKPDKDDDDDEDGVRGKRNIKGTISNLNVAAGTFTLSTKKLGDLTVTATSSDAGIVTTSDVKIFKFPHILASFSDLFNGMKVFVSGIFDSAAKTIKATLIRQRK